MYNILVDYITMSFQKGRWFTDVYPAVGIFGALYKDILIKEIHFPIESALSIKSHFGMPNCLYYESIQIHYDDDMIILEASGLGCRSIEELNKDYKFDWYLFISKYFGGIKERCVNVSRLDVACDAVNERSIRMDRIIRCVDEQRFICKSDYYYTQKGNHEKAVYFGSPKSNRRFRIYDKMMEQNTQECESWVRFEFQLRNDSAISFILNWIKQEGNLVDTYFGVLHDYLCFLVSSKLDALPNHIDRIKTVEWWDRFLHGAPKLAQIYLPGRQYSLQSVADFWNVQCRSTAKLLWQVSLKNNGGDIERFYKDVMSSKLSKKQQDLLAKLYGNQDSIDEGNDNVGSRSSSSV